MKWHFNLRSSETNIIKQKHISQQLSSETFICISAMFLTIFFDVFDSKTHFKNVSNTIYSDHSHTKRKITFRVTMFRQRHKTIEIKNRKKIFL